MIGLAWASNPDSPITAARQRVQRRYTDSATEAGKSHPLAKRKSVVFSLLWNCPTVVYDERKVGGRSFQTRGPETATLRDPYVIVIVLDTVRSPRAAERRQRRPVLAATGTQISVRDNVEYI